MKHLWVLIFVWYFYFQHPLPGGPDGALVQSRVGPFASEATCNEEADGLRSIQVPGLKVSKCIDERKS